MDCVVKTRKKPGLYIYEVTADGLKVGDYIPSDLTKAAAATLERPKGFDRTREKDVTLHTFIANSLKD
ncbi:MAG: hypothetical protein JWO38_2693 [Gemmataceae bacterium]|nr:hypothetical protein [Gemmataceae bacterium]